MEDSSHLLNSSKLKKRKPIFDKDDHSPVNKLTHNMTNSVSKLTNSNRKSDMLSSQTWTMPKPQCQNNHGIHTNLINNSHPHLRVSFSQPKIITQAHQPIIYQQRPVVVRPSTPQPMPNQHPPIVYQDKNMFNQTFSPQINIQPPLKQEFYQTSPVNMTTITRKPRTQFRKEELQQNNRKDSPVFAQRVMKQIQPNIKIERHYAPSDTGTNSFDNSHSRFKTTHSNNQDTTKMQEINSLLSENYNILYNQFFSLKQDIKQKDVIEEQSFLHYSSRQIENIFKNQTKKAIYQLETVYRGNTEKTIKKVCKDRSMIWGSHCLV